MNKKCMLIFISFLIAGAFASLTKAEDIFLTPGESYTVDEVNITCQNVQLTPVVTKECQYWGGLNDESCVYEKNIHAIKGSKCVEECQYWSERNSRCYYSTQCTYDQQSEVFVKTKCAEYDKRNNKCKKEKDIVIN